MLKITHKAIECIGCAQCVEIAPHYWQLDPDGMAQLIHKSHSRKNFDYAQGFSDDQDLLELASEKCPVNIIKIES